MHDCHLGCFVSPQHPYSYECIGTHLRESIMYCRCQVVADKACSCGMANFFIATTLTVFDSGALYMANLTNSWQLREENGKQSPGEDLNI